MSDRIRLLVLDDEPHFRDTKFAIFPSFESPVPVDKAILERNFELSWCHDIEHAKQLFNFYNHARVNHPAALLTQVAYPNLIWVDYNFDNSHHLAKALRRRPALGQRYLDEFDPLRGRPTFVPTPDPEAEPEPESTTRLPGFFAGVQIAMLLQDVACQPIPITAQPDTKETEFHERFLDEQYGSVFRKKKHSVTSWHEFLSRGLDELRNQIVRAVGRGTLTPQLRALERAVASDGELRLDAELAFHSAYGAERFRVEGLFLDLLYSFEPTRGLIPTSGAAAQFGAWADRLVSAAAGPRAAGDVREALALADRHRIALASDQYGRRLELSAQLADAERAGDEATVETVIDSNRGMIEHLGFDPDELALHLWAGTTSSLKIPPSRHRTLGIIDPLKGEGDTSRGHGNDRVVRAAVLALLVYAEFAWCKTQRGDVEALCEQLGELLAADDVAREELLAELAAGDRVPVRPERLPEIARALREGRVDLALAREIGIVHSIANAIAIVSENDWIDEDQDEDDDEEAEPLSGVGSNRPLPRLHDEIATRAMLAHDLLNPAPATLLMTRHRKSGGDGVRKILKRLELDGEPAPLAIDKILHGDLDAGGLRHGDGRLIKVFAASFGFLQRDWPNWMRESSRF